MLHTVTRHPPEEACPFFQELVFMGERCTDDKALQDYGICHTFIKQVHMTCVHK